MSGQQPRGHCFRQSPGVPAPSGMIVDNGAIDQKRNLACLLLPVLFTAGSETVLDECLKCRFVLRCKVVDGVALTVADKQALASIFDDISSLDDVTMQSHAGSRAHLREAGLRLI